MASEPLYFAEEWKGPNVGVHKYFVWDSHGSGTPNAKFAAMVEAEACAVFLDAYYRALEAHDGKVYWPKVESVEVKFTSQRAGE